MRVGCNASCVGFCGVGLVVFLQRLRNMIVLGYRAQFERAAIVTSGRVASSFTDRNDLGRVWGDAVAGGFAPLGSYQVFFIDDYPSLRVDVFSARYGYWIDEWFGERFNPPNLELRTGVNVQNHVHRGYGCFSSQAHYHSKIESLLIALSRLCWRGVI